MVDWRKPFKAIEIGKGRKLRDGKDIAVLSFGHPGNFVTSAINEVRKDGITPAHYDMRFVKPMDEEMLHEIFSNFSKVITVEDGTVVGGFGSAVLEFMNENHYKAEVKIMGIPDKIIEHGTPKQLYDEIGIDANAIAAELRVLSEVGEKV